MPWANYHDFLSERIFFFHQSTLLYRNEGKETKFYDEIESLDEKTRSSNSWSRNFTRSHSSLFIEKMNRSEKRLDCVNVSTINQSKLQLKTNRFLPWVFPYGSFNGRKWKTNWLSKKRIWKSLWKDLDMLKKNNPIIKTIDTYPSSLDFYFDSSLFNRVNSFSASSLAYLTECLEEKNDVVPPNEYWKINIDSCIRWLVQVSLT